MFTHKAFSKSDRHMSRIILLLFLLTALLLTACSPQGKEDTTNSTEDITVSSSANDESGSTAVQTQGTDSTTTKSSATTKATDKTTTGKTKPTYRTAAEMANAFWGKNSGREINETGKGTVNGETCTIYTVAQDLEVVGLLAKGSSGWYLDEYAVGKYCKLVIAADGTVTVGEAVSSTGEALG